MHEPERIVSILDKVECVATASNLPRGTIIRSFSSHELVKHPAYSELQLAVSPAQIAALKRLGDLAFKDPLLITREGVIIDGYARKPGSRTGRVSRNRCRTKIKGRIPDHRMRCMKIYNTNVSFRATNEASL